MRGQYCRIHHRRARVLCFVWGPVMQSRDKYYMVESERSTVYTIWCTKRRRTREPCPARWVYCRAKLTTWGFFSQLELLRRTTTLPRISYRTVEHGKQEPSFIFNACVLAQWSRKSEVVNRLRTCKEKHRAIFQHLTAHRA